MWNVSPRYKTLFFLILLVTQYKRLVDPLKEVKNSLGTINLTSNLVGGNQPEISLIEFYWQALELNVCLLSQINTRKAF